jgi:hypothetical protein
MISRNLVGYFITVASGLICFILGVVRLELGELLLLTDPLSIRLIIDE